MRLDRELRPNLREYHRKKLTFDTQKTIKPEDLGTLFSPNGGKRSTLPVQTLTQGSGAWRPIQLQQFVLVELNVCPR